jgi:hypothetical protein
VISHYLLACPLSVTLNILYNCTTTLMLGQLLLDNNKFYKK